MSICFPSRLTPKFLFALAGLLAAGGCGGPELKPSAGASGPGPAYRQACEASEQKRAADIAAKKYLPIELALHQWPGRELDASKIGYIKEEDLAAALSAVVAPGQPRVRTALVLARGGTGKSRLAESLAAQSCGKIPFFRLDLNLDAVPKLTNLAPGSNAIAIVLAQQLGESDPAKAEAHLKATLGDQPWVAVLDSLDETPLLAREGLAKQIDELVTRVAPQARAVVMTRPPVFSSNYGIATVDARLEMPNLSCEESEAALARNAPDPEERKNLDEFIKRYGLDRKVTTFDRCYYPHLATYRDLQVVQRLAKNAAVGKDTPDFKTFQNSRAQVYTYFATAQLLRDLQGVALTPADAIGVVDAMVAAAKPDQGQRNLPFRQEDCVAACTIPDTAAKQLSCERLLQSALFKPAGSPGEFHFDNQSLGDLFLGRWTARSLVGADGKATCKAIETKAALLESNEVAGFLVGQPQAQACLVEIGQVMCGRGGQLPHIYEQFDQGLPSGPARAVLLADVAEDLAVYPKADKPEVAQCVSGLFAGLGKTIEGLPAKAAAVPEAAPAEAKGSKAGAAGKGAKKGK